MGHWLTLILREYYNPYICGRIDNRGSSCCQLHHHLQYNNDGGTAERDSDGLPRPNWDDQTGLKLWLGAINADATMEAKHKYATYMEKTTIFPLLLSIAPSLWPQSPLKLKIQN